MKKLCPVPESLEDGKVDSHSEMDSKEPWQVLSLRAGFSVSKTQKPFSITWRQCTGVFRPNTVQIYLQSQVYTQEKALIRKDMASQN